MFSGVNLILVGAVCGLLLLLFIATTLALRSSAASRDVARALAEIASDLNPDSTPVPIPPRIGPQDLVQLAKSTLDIVASGRKEKGGGL